ncbi:MAG: hypothetical protein ACI3V0_07425 [Faecousia sp.]
MILGSYCQNEATLLDEDFAGCDFDRFGPQIGGKAVFLSVQKHNADDSGEMNTTNRDICNGEHQRTIGEAALCPSIVPGKGIPPVAFDIADSIMKNIGDSIDEKFTINRMPHTVNTVPALHERHIPERTHDVVFDRRERTKPDRSGGMEIRRVDVQCDPIFSKSISGHAALIVPFMKIRAGEWHMEGLCIGNQLYGTVF